MGLIIELPITLQAGTRRLGGMAIVEILALPPYLTDGGGKGDGLDLYSPQVALNYKMHFRRTWASKGSD